jgi:hypothetical protein
MALVGVTLKNGSHGAHAGLRAPRQRYVALKGVVTARGLRVERPPPEPGIVNPRLSQLDDAGNASFRS